MTDKNNAAQAIQEAERNAAAEEYFGHRTWIKPTASNFRLFEAGFDRAYALLSKLRAEGAQAGDERESFSDWAWKKDGLAIGHMDGQAAAWEAWQERARRAALASAPVDPEAAEVDFLVQVLEKLETWRAEEWNELIERRPAILALLRPLVVASAPVAGEAVAVQVYVYREGNRYLASALLPIDTPLRPGLNTLYAAPQASEAVLPKTVQYSPDDSQERALWKDGWNDCVRHAEALKHQEKSDD